MRYTILVALVVLSTLTAGLRSAAQAPVAETPRASQVKSEVRQILATGDYHFERPGESWLQRAGTWLAERWDRFKRWLGRIFNFGGPRIGSGAGGFYVFPYILVGALILGIAYLIAYAVRHLSLRGKKARRPRIRVDAALEPEESASVEPDAWLAAAKRHAAAGDYKRAYRAVFIGILIRLDRIGAIRYERSRTNGEYLRALRGRPPLFQYVRPLSQAFETHWYGHTPVTEADYQEALQAYAGLPDTAA